MLNEETTKKKSIFDKEEDILKSLIKLYEKQEKIKIKYKIIKVS